jgi:hypothetical protein
MVFSTGVPDGTIRAGGKPQSVAAAVTLGRVVAGSSRPG